MPERARPGPRCESARATERSVRPSTCAATAASGGRRSARPVCRHAPSGRPRTVVGGRPNPTCPGRTAAEQSAATRRHPLPGLPHRSTVRSSRGRRTVSDPYRQVADTVNGRRHRVSALQLATEAPSAVDDRTTGRSIDRPAPTCWAPRRAAASSRHHRPRRRRRTRPPARSRYEPAARRTPTRPPAPDPPPPPGPTHRGRRRGRKPGPVHPVTARSDPLAERRGRAERRHEQRTVGRQLRAALEVLDGRRPSGPHRRPGQPSVLRYLQRASRPAQRPCGHRAGCAGCGCACPATAWPRWR